MGIVARGVQDVPAWVMQEVSCAELDRPGAPSDDREGLGHHCAIAGMVFAVANSALRCARSAWFGGMDWPRAPRPLAFLNGESSAAEGVAELDMRGTTLVAAPAVSVDLYLH